MVAEEIRRDADDQETYVGEEEAGELMVLASWRGGMGVPDIWMLGWVWCDGGSSGW